MYAKLSSFAQSPLWEKGHYSYYVLVGETGVVCLLMILSVIVLSITAFERKQRIKYYN